MGLGSRWGPEGGADIGLRHGCPGLLGEARGSFWFSGIVCRPNPSRRCYFSWQPHRSIFPRHPRDRTLSSSHGYNLPHGAVLFFFLVPPVKLMQPVFQEPLLQGSLQKCKQKMLEQQNGCDKDLYRSWVFGGGLTQVPLKTCCNRTYAPKMAVCSRMTPPKVKMWVF